MSPITGTFSAVPCTFNIAAANDFVTHFACLASATDLFGMGHELTDTNATTRTSPLLMRDLHVRQRARPEGARLIEKQLSLAFIYQRHYYYTPPSYLTLNTNK